MPSSSLTPRECEIVQGIRDAKLNKEIAADLGLTEGTVKEYIGRIFKKLKLKNRTAVAVWASHGLLVVLSLLAATAFGAASHSVTLQWADLLNPSGTTYNVYRSSGSCVSPSFSVLFSAGASTNFLDSMVSAGSTYCYQVTAVLNGMESLPSNSVSAIIPITAPVIAVVPNVSSGSSISSGVH